MTPTNPPANVFLLAADNHPSLLPLLREKPALASSQDPSGYSLVHAAASYNHLDLLRTLISEFKVPVDLRDEDDETALFVVETPEAARVLIEELGADVEARGEEGLSAREKIGAEAEFPAVEAYLKKVENKRGTKSNDDGEAFESSAGIDATGTGMPAPPEGVSISMGVMGENEGLPEPDPEFRRRIEELSRREDFDSAESQAELRRLVEEALGGQHAT